MSSSVSQCNLDSIISLSETPLPLTQTTQCQGNSSFRNMLGVPWFIFSRGRDLFLDLGNWIGRQVPVVEKDTDPVTDDV